MPRKKLAVPVSTRTLIQRISRKLKERDKQIRKLRGARAYLDLGKYYLLDISRNLIAGNDIALGELGRALRVQAPWEGVVEDEA